MGRLIKSMLILTVVVGGIWLAVIVSWQSSRTMPSEGEIALYMVALPLGVLLLGWLTLRGIRAWRAPKPQASTEAQPDEAVAPSAPLPRAVVLASAAESAAGTSVTEILAGLASPVTQLDASLTTPEGFPIMAARVQRLSTPDLRAAALMAHSDPRVLRDASLRAGALLEGVIDALVLQARENQPSAVSEADWPMLRLQVVLPARWSEATRARIAESARREAAAHWPAARLRLGSVPATDGTQAFVWLHDWLRAEPASDDAALYVLAACDSLIDPHEVSALNGERLLLTPAQPDGRLPGESAAGLLLAREPAAVPEQAATPTPARPSDPTLADKYPPLPNRPKAPSASTPVVVLPQDAPRLVLAPAVVRGQAADLSTRPAEASFSDAARSVMTQCGVEPERVVAMISDADHRGARPMETPALAADAAPHLMPGQGCTATGAACGYSGAAGALMTLSLAASLTQSSGQPSFALTVQDPVQRHLALFLAPSSPAA